MKYLISLTFVGYDHKGEPLMEALLAVASKPTSASKEWRLNSSLQPN
jgi:hypothetical protein